MSGFELFIILIIVANVVAAILKKSKQQKGQVPNSPQRHQGEFEEDQEEGPAFPDFGGYERRQTPARTVRMETIEEEAPSLEARAGVEGVAETTAPAAPPRKRSAALQVIDFSHRTPRILGLQSKSDLRRAFLLSEVLGSPRSLSQD